MADTKFNRLAILFPTTVAGLYWRRATARACVASIVVGESLLIGFHYGVIPASWAGGFLPVTPIIAVTTLVLVGGSLVGGDVRSVGMATEPTEPTEPTEHN